jgi:AraC-like DNA-binding protein
MNDLERELDTFKGTNISSIGKEDRDLFKDDVKTCKDCDNKDVSSFVKEIEKNLDNFDNLDLEGPPMPANVNTEFKNQRKDKIIEHNTHKEPGNITMLHEKHLQNIRIKLEDWVKKNGFLSEDITLNNLSSDIEVPLYHLTYYFNQVNDEKFIDWRNNLRVNFAINLMKNELEIKKTLEAIGKESGFRSYSTFRQAFKRRTGTVPKDFI